MKKLDQFVIGSATGNGQLWDVIAEYAHCVGEYMHARPKDLPARSASLKAAMDALTAVIGKRDDDSALAKQADAAPVESDEDEWRRLALQFDGHRMQAIGLLKLLLSYTKACEGMLNASPAGQVTQVEQFLSAGPLSGEEVLAQRIAALAQRGVSEAVPVAWIAPRLLESLSISREVAKIPSNSSVAVQAGQRNKEDLPLYTTPPAAPVALRDAAKSIISGVREFYLGMFSGHLKNESGHMLDHARSDEAVDQVFQSIADRFAALAATQPTDKEQK